MRAQINNEELAKSSFDFFGIVETQLCELRGTSLFRYEYYN